jgi:DNA-binding beta-propeller fold protein YncE
MQHLDVSDVAVDAQDRVYLLTRFDLGVWIYEADGTFVTSWTSDYVRQGNHGIQVGPDGSVWVIDFKQHFVAKHSPDGEVLQAIGGPDQRSDTGIDESLNYGFDMLKTIKRAAGPFNGPTNMAFAADGSFFVSDGYCNASIHHFTADGDLIGSWGTPGSEPGHFMNPHHISVTSDGRLVVADRENCRVQVFEQDGTLVHVVDDLRRPAAAAMTPDGYLCVAESEVQPGHHFPFRGHFDDFAASRLSVFSPDWELVFRADVPTGPPLLAGSGSPGEGDPDANQVTVKMAGPNGMAVDSRGDVYIAEVVYSMYNHRTLGGIGDEHPALHKFARVPAADAN